MILLFWSLFFTRGCLSFNLNISTKEWFEKLKFWAFSHLIWGYVLAKFHRNRWYRLSTWSAVGSSLSCNGSYTIQLREQFGQILSEMTANVSYSWVVIKGYFSDTSFLIKLYHSVCYCYHHTIVSASSVLEHLYVINK
jgi:hypothetical protein